MNKLAFALACAASTLSVPTLAAERGPDIRVAYADLKLGDAAGREVLDRRIASAVRTACGFDSRSFDLVEKRAAKRCVAAKQAEIMPLREAALASRGMPVRVATVRD